MNKLVVGFFVFFVINVILGGVMEGGGGLNATRLTQPITSTDTTITVASTEGFLESNFITVGDEDIRYVSTTATTFVVSATGRGYNDTTATSHPALAKAYSPSAGLVNASIGFNVASTDSAAPGVNIFVVFWNFAWKTAPKFLTWDFAQFRVAEWTQYIRLLFALIGAGFIIYIGYEILRALGGVAQSLLTRFRP